MGLLIIAQWAMGSLVVPRIGVQENSTWPGRFVQNDQSIAILSSSRVKRDILVFQQRRLCGLVSNKFQVRFLLRSFFRTLR